MVAAADVDAQAEPCRLPTKTARSYPAPSNCFCLWNECSLRIQNPVAGMVKRYHESFPSFSYEFDSRYPLHITS